MTVHSHERFIEHSRSWAREFRKSADKMPPEPPEDSKIDPLLWQAQRQAFLVMADDLETEAAKVERGEVGTCLCGAKIDGAGP